MAIFGKALRTSLAVAFVIGLLAVGGCTKYAGPDDLKKLDAANKAAVMAEKDLDKAKAERRSLEQKVTDKQNELNAAKSEFDAVKTR